jgi:mannose-6-phosphate isomerase-like protein (cupin superfamily)
MTAFELREIITRRRSSGRPYLEFLRVPALSMGLYVLEAGATDPQKPHTEDEVYYVISGRGCIQVGADDRTVESGTLVFVPSGVRHRFHDILQDLQLLVFFAPAEREADHGG